MDTIDSMENLDEVDEAISFEDLGLDEATLEAISAKGFETPTPCPSPTPGVHSDSRPSSQ